MARKKRGNILDKFEVINPDGTKDEDNLGDLIAEKVGGFLSKLIDNFRGKN